MPTRPVASSLRSSQQTISSVKRSPPPPPPRPCDPAHVATVSSPAPAAPTVACSKRAGISAHRQSLRLPSTSLHFPPKARCCRTLPPKTTTTGPPPSSAPSPRAPPMTAPLRDRQLQTKLRAAAPDPSANWSSSQFSQWPRHRHWHAADATPRRAATRDRDLLNASNATPKASHRLRASVGLDAESQCHLDLVQRSASHRHTQARTEHRRGGAGETSRKPRQRRQGSRRGRRGGRTRTDRPGCHCHQGRPAPRACLAAERSQSVALVRKPGLQQPARQPEYKRDGSPFAASAVAACPANSVASRPPSSLSDTRMSRSGSTDSYATADSHTALAKYGSLSQAPPRIYTENVSMLADRDLASSPLETSSSGHSSFRIRSPALTVATSSLGHTSPAGTMARGSPSPSLSVRESVSPEVPPKDADWRSRSPALSVSASESGDGAASPAAGMVVIATPEGTFVA